MDLHLKDAKTHAIYCFLWLWFFLVFFVYKFQFRGLQPFRVKHDDHSLLIFVVCKRCSTENFLLDVS